MKTQAIFLLVLGAFITASLFILSERYHSELLSQQAETLSKINELSLSERSIRSELANSSFRVNYNLDQINQLLFQINQITQTIKLDSRFQSTGFKTFIKQLESYESASIQRAQFVDHFQTINALVKNSVIQLPQLSQKLIKNQSENEDLFLQMTHINNQIFLASNTQSPDLLPELNQKLKALESSKPKQDHSVELKLFLAHARTISNYLPEYFPLLKQSSSTRNIQLLDKIRQTFLEASDQSSRENRWIPLALGLLFAIFFIALAITLIALERKQKRLQEIYHQLESNARTDSLTGLGNRFALEQQFDQNPHYRTAIILNIVAFKDMNDFYGNAAGNHILQAVASLLKSSCSAENQSCIYRLGNDDFCILSDRPAAETEVLTEQLINLLTQSPIHYHGNEVHVQMRAGLSEASPIIETADLALKEARKHKQSIWVYQTEQALEARVAKNLNMLKILHHALENGGVEAWFQPIYNFTDSSIKRFESLIRIRHEGDILSPYQFLTVAREAGIYPLLEKKMVESFFNAISHYEGHFSLNLSAEDLLDSHIMALLESGMSQNPDTRGRVSIELLETDAIHDYKQIQAKITHLREIGCSIAIDDFGSGYSSLRHMLELHPDSLKIDASLIKDIDRDNYAFALVENIVHIAKSLGINDVVAEHVHNKDVLKVVQGLGIQCIQGFYIGKPCSEPVYHLPESMNWLFDSDSDQNQ